MDTPKPDIDTVACRIAQASIIAGSSTQPDAHRRLSEASSQYLKKHLLGAPANPPDPRRSLPVIRREGVELDLR